MSIMPTNEDKAVESKVVELLGALKDSLTPRITPEERAVIEAAKAWASVRPRMKSEIPFTYSNNLFKAVDALEKAEKGRTQDE